MKVKYFILFLVLPLFAWASLSSRGQSLSAVADRSKPTPTPFVPRRQRDKDKEGHSTKPRPSSPPIPVSKLKPGEWEAFVDPEQQIFPSFLLASATLRGSWRDNADNADDDQTAPTDKTKPADKAGPPEKATDVIGDKNGLLGVTICNPAANTSILLEVKANAYMEDSTLEVSLPEAGKEYHLLPKVNYKYDALNIVRQSRPVNVVCGLKVDGKDKGQRIVTARVRPINDCLFAYQDPDGDGDYMDISWMFAAYVNEDDPAIPGLLKEAQETGVVDGFDAYQSENSGRVLLQVFAVWLALQKHGIKYSDIGTTAADSDLLYSMHVRFIEESLAETHANCVDASVLLASVLRRMGIEPFLVIEPDHMFLGFYLDKEGKDFACLETTMLSNADPPKFKENRILAKTASKTIKKMKGWGSFNDALNSAGKEYKENKKKYGDESAPQYSIVSIEAARHEGIAPIAYLKEN